MLAIANLEVAYQTVVRVLQGVSLRVPDGAIVALLGPNGAGKTTTLRAITGLLPIHDGEAIKGKASFGSLDLLQAEAASIVRAGIVQVLEGRRVFIDMTVEENLLAGGYTRSGSEVRREISEFYRRFPVLGERRHHIAGYLSGGEQQMLAIARALLAKPKLLLLDEPSLGLAPKVVEDVVRLIREINAAGVGILLVEQNAAIALELAEHAYIMENGRIVIDGSSDELAEDRDVQEFYLGKGGEGVISYREAKRYHRRKRWLS
jgi:branched-chain amino acid transport system ATP-binding protein